MLGRFRRYFFAGLAAFLPLMLTVYLIVITFNFADGILGKYLAPYFRREFGFYVRGIGIVLYIFIITFIGFLVSTFIDRRIYNFFEGLLLKLPFFKQVYPAFKEIASFFIPNEKGKPASFKQVVLVPYPSKGLLTLGFLTNMAAKEINDQAHGEMCNVFIPSVPNPLTGFVVLVPKRDVIFMNNITVEGAFKFIVSGGVVNPTYKELQTGNGTRKGEKRSWE